VKAGYLIKKKGIWYLTPEGEETINLGPEKLFHSAAKAYKEWRIKHPKESKKDDSEVVETEDQRLRPDAGFNAIRSGKAGPAGILW